MINAARALCPNPIPSEIPAAIVITFLIAPPVSTPVVSLLEYTLNLEECICAAVFFENSSSRDAKVKAAGNP